MPPVVLIVKPTVDGRPQTEANSYPPVASLRRVAFLSWLGREDSNLRMPDPKTGALPLGYAPMRISETYRKQANTLNATLRDTQIAK